MGQEKRVFNIRLFSDSGAARGVASVEALATFREVIGGHRFTFHVHANPGLVGYTVSEHVSGRRVGPVPVAARLDRNPDYKGAGRRVVAGVVEKHGADRVAAVMRAAADDRAN